ncbi:MAG: hypothetical protein P8100_08710 [bacterium]|jgi:regulator of replication initiation timing
MESIKKLNKEIMDLRVELQENYPELEPYHSELQSSIPDNEELTMESLIEYRDTLKATLEKYKQEENSK